MTQECRVKIKITSEKNLNNESLARMFSFNATQTVCLLFAFGENKYLHKVGFWELWKSEYVSSNKLRNG